jgi:MATE family multidrug resistance protein
MDCVSASVVAHFVKMLTGLMHFVFEIWHLAWPAMLRNFLGCASDRVTLSVVGHYDPDQAHYDGAGLGKMFSNITGLSIGLGLILGLGTMCSQAFGAGRSAIENGMHLRRCGIILCPALVFTSVSAIYAREFLIYVGQPEDVAVASAHFAQVCPRPHDAGLRTDRDCSLAHRA